MSAGKVGDARLMSRRPRLSLLRASFAISTDKNHYYFGGILLHDADDGLAAVASDESGAV